MGTDIIVVLNSYDMAHNNRGPRQLNDALAAFRADADGVEIRGELLGSDPVSELDALRDRLPAGFIKAYSDPRGLWTAQGDLDLTTLAEATEAARRLEVPWLKMNIGGFRYSNGRDIIAVLETLGEHLAGSDIKLLVENMQTPEAGTIRPLRAFRNCVEQAGLRIGGVFDVGNWHVVGEDPVTAAIEFTQVTDEYPSWVDYMHVKGMQFNSSTGLWNTVRVDQSQAPWRTILDLVSSYVPWGIEYPLNPNGDDDDLVEVTRLEVERLRMLAEPVPMFRMA